MTDEFAVIDTLLDQIAVPFRIRVKPEGVNQWAGPYMPKDIPNDPWGVAYVYRYPGEHGDEPDIISYGADHQAGGEGEAADVASWK